MTTVSTEQGSPLAQLGNELLVPYKRNEQLFVGGEGSWLYDHTGRRFLDFTSGIAVLALGHRSPLVADAIRAAADELIHTSNLFHTPAPIELAKRLVERSFADKVFLCNSGTEAIEASIKFARLKGGEGRRTIGYFNGAFHGRTLGALAATDRAKYQDPFKPLPQGYERLILGDLEGLSRIDEGFAAVLIEPLQGEGGVRPVDDAFLRALRARCDEVGALLICDEIQCGVGRTGELWAHSRSGIRPDILALAKPLAGGLPIGAVLMTREVGEATWPGCHGTTFGGNPLICRVACAVFDAVSTDTQLAAVQERSAQLRAGLEAIDSPFIKEVRGRGLLLGLELSEDAAPVIAAARERGLLLVGAGPEVIRFAPPLNVSAAEVDEALSILRAALPALEKGPA